MSSVGHGYVTFPTEFLFETNIKCRRRCVGKFNVIRKQFWHCGWSCLRWVLPNLWTNYRRDCVVLRVQDKRGRPTNCFVAIFPIYLSVIIGFVTFLTLSNQNEEAVDAASSAKRFVLFTSGRKASGHQLLLLLMVSQIWTKASVASIVCRRVQHLLCNAYVTHTQCPFRCVFHKSN